MGEKARRSAIFRASHPSCCFCGGLEPTTTQDHIPPRSAFCERRWPEEHVFPACKACNDATRASEAIFAFYVRMTGWDDDLRERDLAASLKIASSVAKLHPDCFPKALRQIEEHRLRREHSIDVNEGRFIAIPKKAVGHFEVVYRKLCVALYYKYVGRPMPLSHQLSSQVRVGATLTPTDELVDFFRLARFTHRSIQSGRFNGQFVYSYDYNPKLDLFVVLAKFGGAFYGMCAALPGDFDDTSELEPLTSLSNAFVIESDRTCAKTAKP